MKSNIKKEIASEMKAITREYSVCSWKDQKVEEMEPEEAFNRGYYRALQNVLSAIK